MKIYIDADACPVKDIILRTAIDYSIEVILVHSICHFSNKSESSKYTVIMVDNESQAADMAIINSIKKGDLVVTGDYGLASIVLGKGCYAISFNGMVYTSENIEKLLFERHISATIRRGGGRVKGPLRRTLSDDENFRKNLNLIIEQIMKDI